VGDETRHIDQVEGPVAYDLKRNVDVAALRVTRPRGDWHNRNVDRSKGRGLSRVAL